MIYWIAFTDRRCKQNSEKIGTSLSRAVLLDRNRVETISLSASDAFAGPFIGALDVANSKPSVGLNKCGKSGPLYAS